MSIWLNLSRQYALCGYNTILQALSPQPDESLLEIGCGEGRNLQRIAYRYPALDVYGLEPSEAMLAIAKRRLAFTHDAQQIMQKYEHEHQIMPTSFNQDKHYDHVLFSHVLAVLPNWKAAIEQALLHLKPGGMLHIVEFSHISEVSWLSALPNQWGVPRHNELPSFLQCLAKQDGGRLKTNYLPKQMTFVAHYHKASSHFYPPLMDRSLLSCLDF